MQKIKTIKQLDKALKEGKQDFFILLAGGLMRSSKSILKIGKKYSVINEIDDSEQFITEKGLFNSKITNIGEAMKKGSFYAY